MKPLKRQQIGWKATGNLLVIFGLLTLSVVTTLWAFQTRPAEFGLIQRLLLAVEVLGMAAIGAFVYYLYTRVLAPLKALTRDAAAVADGDFHRDIEGVGRTDEVGALTRSVEEMRDQLICLVEEARQFERAVEETGHSVIITDADETIEYVNPAFERITGYQKSEAIGETPRLLKSGEHDSKVYEEMWETLLNGESWEGEFVNQRKTGERMYVQQTIAPVRDDDGEIEQFVSIGTDLTEQKIREQVLEVYNRVLRHNLRNRVNIVNGNAEMLHSQLSQEIRTTAETLREVTTNPAGDDLDRVETAAAELESLAESLENRAETILDAGERLGTLNQKAGQADKITRVAENEVPDRPLSEHLLAERDAAAEQFPTANVSLSIPDADPIPCKRSMRVAINQLVENAIEHNDCERPSVDMELTVKSDQLVLTIADDGPGIPEYERRVLEKGEETPLAHGSGLGLWLVYWIVTMNGGRLEIRENEPRGTVVELVLPLPRIARTHEGSGTQSMMADD